MSREHSKSKQIHPRKLAGKAMHQSFLIICEGDTEKGYFNSFKKRAQSVHGGSALAIVQLAIARKKGLEKPVDQVWVVFDKDDIKDDDFNRAVKLAIDNGIHPAWSNQAFELWFILHYQQFNKPSNRSNYQKLLQKSYSTYFSGAKSENQGKQLFNATIDKLNIAIENAQKGYNSFDPQSLPSQRQSSTLVYRLVEAILTN